MNKVRHTSDSKYRVALTYLYGGVVNYRPGETLGPRQLSDWEMVLIIEGNVTYLVNGVAFPASPGSLILAQPDFHEEYRWDPVSHTRHAYFHFDLKQIPSDWPAPKSWPIVQQRPAPVLPVLFRHILQRIGEHPDWPLQKPDQEVNRLIETLLDIYLRNRADQSARFESDRPEPVNRAIKLMREVIDESPHRSLTLVDLARNANVTDKHLCRLFQQTIGHSPKQTFTLMKLQLALALLVRSNLTVKQIAQRCGFDNPFYFSRCFSKAFGQPPSTVRKDMAAGKPPPINLLPVDITPRIYW